MKQSHDVVGRDISNIYLTGISLGAVFVIGSTNHVVCYLVIHVDTLTVLVCCYVESCVTKGFAADTAYQKCTLYIFYQQIWQMRTNCGTRNLPEDVVPHPDTTAFLFT